MDETNTQEEGSIQTAEEIFQGLTTEQPPEETVETPTPTPEELAEAQSEGTVEIDGEAYTYDELRAGMLRQADYTRKTQDLSRRSKELEPVEQVYNFVGTLPAEKQEEILRYIDSVARETRGFGTGVTNALNQNPTTIPQGNKLFSDELVTEGFDPKYVEVVRKVEQRAANAEQKNAQLEGVIRDLVPQFKGLVQEIKGDTEAQTVASEIKRVFGKEVTPLELRELSKKSGIQDMEAAWLKANRDALRAPAKVETPKKPVIPNTDSRKFVMTSEMKPEDVFQGVMKGEIDINQ